MRKCYTFYADGFYAGEGTAFRSLPHGSTYDAPPSLPWVKVWPQYVDGAWHLVEDHRERSANIFGEDLAQAATDYWLPDDTWQSQPRHMTRPGPLPAGALLERPQKPEQTLDEVKSDALARIDATTSAGILAGFDYEVDGEKLHFSYDSFDQQNFADSANVASRSLAGENDLPASVNWNAYRNWQPETGGELVRLSLEAASFLALYTQGALAHKAACMEEGGLRKERIAKATSVDEVKELLDEWSI